jgi:hypothetical protein
MCTNHRLKIFLIGLLTLCLSHLPQVTFAEIVLSKKMVSTSDILLKFDRKNVEEKMTTYLDHEQIKEKLMAQGISADEAKARLLALSDSELQNLSVQIDQARHGGDILVTVLLVVLIIYIVKRI